MSAGNEEALNAPASKAGKTIEINSLDASKLAREADSVKKGITSIKHILDGQFSREALENLSIYKEEYVQCLDRAENSERLSAGGGHE